MLPILGPSNLRDALSLFADSQVDPIFYLEDTDAQWSVVALKGVDARADLISVKKVVDQASLDEYSFFRSGYFQRREYLVFDGNPPMDDEEFLDDE